MSAVVDARRTQQSDGTHKAGKEEEMSKTGGIGRWVRNFLGISALSSEMDKLRREVKDFGDVHNDNHLEVIRRQELAEKRVDDMWRDVRKLIKESTDEVRKEQSESSAQILSAIGDLGKK